MHHRFDRPMNALTLVLSLVAGTALSSGCASSLRSDSRAPQATTGVAVVNEVEQAPPAIPMGDERVVSAILEEGLNRNRVMDHHRAFTDIGPRLTGSSNLDRAQQAALAMFQSWGLSAKLEPWGEVATRFDRGPTKGIALMPEIVRERRPREGEPSEPAKAPEYKVARELVITTPAWTRGTDGPARGLVVKLPETDEEYAKVKDKLKDAWILMPPLNFAQMRDRGRAWYDAVADARKKVASGEVKAEELPIRERLLFDGIRGYISNNTRDERVLTGGAPGWRERVVADIGPEVRVSVRLSDYDYLNSRLSDGDAVMVEIDAKNNLVPGPFTQANVVAEIPGSERPDEVVIISGHLDSWDGPGSQGSVDNATGSAVTLETARILSTVFAKTGTRPKRTIRFCLWTGEEQGLLGSEAYVQQLKARGELEKVSACFVDDGGTNWQGGVPAADTMVPYLAAAIAPTNNRFWSEVDQKWMNVNVRATGPGIKTHGSSDHAPFNKEGIPGFFWDEIGRADYTFAHHTQNDNAAQAIPEYLRQSATNSAIVAYNLANAPGLMPRGEKMDIDRGSLPSGPNLPGATPTTPRPTN